MDGGGHELYPGGGAQVGHGGHGDGHHAVGAADGSVALVEAGYDDLVNAEVVKADGDGADVHDGVHGAHLVEHDGVRRGAVRLGLRLGRVWPKTARASSLARAVSPEASMTARTSASERCAWWCPCP